MRGTAALPIALICIGAAVAFAPAETIIRPRFVDNGDGTVGDMLTGLTWQRSPSESEMRFDEALAYAEGLVLAGREDWRLPELIELLKLVEAEDSGNPARLEAQGFGHIPSSDYWSTRLFERYGRSDEDSLYAWAVNLAEGRRRLLNTRDGLGRAWALRGEPWRGEP
jgi:hypothetical protein